MKKITTTLLFLFSLCVAYAQSQAPEFQYANKTVTIYTERKQYVVHKPVLDVFDVAENQCIIDAELLRKILFTELSYRSKLDGVVHYQELSDLLLEERIHP
jgi:sulfur relay (sulfurtransferase) DsrF/TusC family protein